MSNFEKQLLNKLPEYYNDGLIDTISEQRLRIYLNTKLSSSENKFNLSILYIVAFILGVLASILYLRSVWENLQDITKLIVGFTPIVFSAILTIFYLIKYYTKKTLFCDVLAILNILGVTTATFITNSVFDIYNDGLTEWATIIFTSLPIVFIFASPLAAMLLIFFAITNISNIDNNISNLLYLSNIALAFFIFKKSDLKYGLTNTIAYVLLCIFLPIIVVPNFAFSSMIATVAMGIAIPFLKYAKNKNIAVIFSWGWLIILLMNGTNCYSEITALSIRSFFESLKYTHNLAFLAIGTIYIINFYFFYKFIRAIFDKETNKAYVVMSSIGFFPIFIFNTKDGLVNPDTLQNYLTFYTFISAFAFLISAIKNKSFTLLNCGSLLVITWAFAKFCSSDVSLVSASKSLFISGLCILIINIFFNKILTLKGE